MAAIEQAYRDRLTDFLRIAQGITGSAETARDAVHEAFVSAVHKRSSYRNEGSIDAWICRAVVHAALDHVRQRAVVPLDDQMPADAETTSMSDRRWVRSAIAGLPERQRLMLFLRYFGDFDYAAIAAILEVKEGTVAATLHAGRESLKRRLVESNPEEDTQHAYTRRAL